jgi:hypothetical protein
MREIDATERALRVERCLALADLAVDGLGWRIASSAFVERWKRDEAELTARGYRGLYNRFGDLLVSCWPIAQQLAEATATPPFIEKVDPETGEITSTPALAESYPHIRRRKKIQRRKELNTRPAAAEVAGVKVAS